MEWNTWQRTTKPGANMAKFVDCRKKKVNENMDWQKEFDRRFVGDNRPDGMGYKLSMEDKQIIIDL